MFIWSEKAGTMAHHGFVTAHGYSGADLGKNNPAMASAKGVGPIPVGNYTMTGIENNGPTGPFTIILVPKAGTDTLGRGDFRIHGDSVAHPGEASHGCIILPHDVRVAIWNSGDHDLQVTV